MTDQKKMKKGLGARLPLIVGYGAVLFLVGGLGAWSLGTEIAGAVVSPGTVKVESDRQVIQHPDGGVVGEILARNGDKVKAGDILLRLDDTFLKSELVIVEGQLVELRARGARLEAERDERDNPQFDINAQEFRLDPAAVQRQIEGQKSLFDARRVSLAKEVEQLAEQQQQIDLQIEGTEAQIEALRRQLSLIEKELADLTGLYEKGLLPATRVLELQREEARLLGEIGRLTSTVAEARTRISSIAIEILKLADQRREEAITQLRDLKYNEIELEERRLNLIERLARLDVRAPVDGVVFNSKVLALQSVVQAAEPMMYLVPGDQPMQVSVRINPIHIDQVYVGQDVELMFTTFDRRTTPEVAGTVLRVSADAEVDQNTGQSYYEGIVIPDAVEMAALTEVTLLPGMPVEAFLKTRDRTPLDYLTHPLMIYFNRAFREE